MAGADREKALDAALANIEKQFGSLPQDVKQKIIVGNAMETYGLG